MIGEAHRAKGVYFYGINIKKRQLTPHITAPTTHTKRKVLQAPIALLEEI